MLATDPHYVEILARHSDDEMDDVSDNDGEGSPGVSGNGDGQRGPSSARFSENGW